MDSLLFSASKALWFLAQPSSLILLLLLAGFFLHARRRVKAGRRCFAAAAAAYAISGLSPLGNALILPLEMRFERPDLAASSHIQGIIVLGGAIDTRVSAAHRDIGLNEAAERMTEAVALARRLPQARVVFSGGDGGLLYVSEPEAAAARRLFEALGVEPSRLLFEAGSRNTYENAAFTRELLLRQSPGRWLLVTSAFHMPRAMALFRAAGVEVLPWPVDYRTRGQADLTRFFSSPAEGLRRVDIACREWAALVVYWLTGKIGTVFPGPE